MPMMAGECWRDYKRSTLNQLSVFLRRSRRTEHAPRSFRLEAGRLIVFCEPSRAESVEAYCDAWVRNMLFTRRF
jgi:hypothetical protein